MNSAETVRSAGPAVSAIVVNHRRAELTLDCLASLETALDAVAGAEAIVVDNGSGDGSAERIAAGCPTARLVALDDNRGFAAAVNAAVEASSGDWLLLLNNDATVEREAVERLVRVAREAGEDVGALAAEMRFAEAPSVVNSAGIGVDRLGVAYDLRLGEPAAAEPGAPVEVFGASGGAALVRRSMLDDVGGFDASFFFALEDVDLAWRARMAGWRALHVPGAIVLHHHGATGSHASAFKNFHVGLNRVRVLAKNADSRHLRRYGLLIVAYDLAYVAYAVVADRTLAPLRGRLRGLREWRGCRRAGAAGRRPVELEPVRGVRAALGRRRAWEYGSGAEAGGGGAG